MNGYKLYAVVFENVAKEAVGDWRSFIKKGGVVIWVVGEKQITAVSGTSFKQALFFQKAGFNIHDTIYLLQKQPYANCWA